MRLVMHLLLLQTPASGEPRWLQWQAPPECPDVAVAARATSERLGREPRVGEVEAVGVVEATEGGYQLRLDLTVDGPTQTIELVSQDCASLGDAAGLVIATSIDPTLGGAEPEPAIPEPEPEPEPEAEPEPEVEPAPQRPDPAPAEAPTPTASPPEPTDAPSRGPEALSSSVLGGGDLGTLPRVTGGPRLRVDLAWRHWQLGIGGSYLAPQVETNDVGVARVQAAVAELRGCGRLRWNVLELPLCGAVEAGVTHAQGRRDPGPRSARGPRLALLASAAPRVRVSPRVGLVANLELAFAPVRTAYVVEDPGDPAVVFAPSAVSGRLWLGIEVILRTWG